MNQNIKTICAYCRVYGRPVAVIKDGDDTQPLSHGICPACFENVTNGKPFTHVAPRAA